jgi:hypothetical protein
MLATKTAVALRVANIENNRLMENNQQKILSEIKSLMTSVRHQLEELDVKIAQWQQMMDPEEVIDVTSVIDLELDDDFPVLTDDDPVSEPLPETVSEPVPEEPILEEPVPDEESVLEEESALENEQLFEDEQQTDESVFDLPADDDLPFFDVPQETAGPVQPMQEPAPVLNDLHATEEKSAVIDVMTRHHAWRTAMPAAPVKDIRGAIALMDRVLFINNLFGTDPMAFQDALTRINQMETLDQAVEYLAAVHPEWDFDSDIVYSFMMAVRRKVNA